MPKTTFTPEELKGYFSGDIKHNFYQETVDMAIALKVHSDGVFPENLLKKRRPNEPEEVFAYRQDIFIAKTKPIFSKVVNSLSKIRRSSDWSIRYEKIEEFTKISEEEALNTYCEETFPYFTSVTNWVFSVLLKEYLVDPNAVVFVLPLENIEDETVYVRPFPTIFSSVDVLEYVHEDYAILVNPLGSTYTVKGRPQKGKSFFVVTTTTIQRYDQINAKMDMAVKLNIEHGLEQLPVFRIGAVILRSEGNTYLHESRIAAVLPELDEAIREYSDLQAAKVLHIYPERWEFSNNECTNCKGTGLRREIKDEKPCDVPCEPCHGRGYTVAGPYSKIVIRPVNNALETGGQVPSPPAGYVQKDVEIVKIQDEGIEKHIVSALAAINFEFLMQSPLNQSGTAKEVDKDELNNTVHSIAEDIVSVMDKIYLLIALFRYNLQYSIEDIEEMVPKITVPEKYDILSATHLEQELASAKTNKANPVILNALEVEYSNKKFNNDPSVRDRLKLILELDPLPNVTDEEKMSRLSNKGITPQTYVISSNIHEFVQRAIEEDPTFPDLELKVQKDKMAAYAKELKDEMDEAAKIAQEEMLATGIDATGKMVIPPTNGRPKEEKEVA